MTTADTLRVRPFQIDVPASEVFDLRRRLEAVRLPHPAAVPGWEYGTPNEYLAHAIDVWLHDFDWTAVQDDLNRYPRVMTEIDGQPLQFIHIRSPHPGATPLLLAHTYPGSSVDYLGVIDRLVDPVRFGGSAEYAFDVVIPDAPGFGFSNPVTSPGWTTARIARAYDRLMRALGHAAYGVHGSDAGAMIARELGLLQPEGFLGLHVLQLFSFPSGDPAESERLAPADHAALAHLQWFQAVGGYNAMNASRPQTVAVGLSDSPTALLAYSELFESFGNGTARVPLRTVLTEVTVNWFTNAAAGMSASYLENSRAHAAPQVNHARTGITVFEHDFQTIRLFAERDNDTIESWTTRAGGGHFAALEAPEALAAEIRDFFFPARGSTTSDPSSAWDADRRAGAIAPDASDSDGVRLAAALP